MHRTTVLTICAALLVAGCQPSGEEAATAGASALAPAAGAPPLYANLGRHHFPISSRLTRTQQYFDQGLRLTYAFNHAEAIRAFTEAARLDPECAICHWGVALAYGPNINAPMDSAAGVLAYQAVQRARALAEGAPAHERALIDALSERYAEVPPADRAALDSAYARAMADVVRRFPGDLEAPTLYAEALMTLRPWNYWTREGEPHPGTEEILSLLEGVLRRNPDHPGACHFYIHAVEAAQPEKAVACAERLARLMPGAGHLVHMPAHIYIRVGRWADAIEANHHAVHADESYIADQRPTGVYPVAYYPHNHHFLSFAATMVGRSEQAIQSARAVVDAVPVEVAREVPEVEALLPYLHLTLVTFGRWDEVLSTPAPPRELRFATGLVEYARGVAHAARGNQAEARAALDTVRAIARGDHGEMGVAVLEIAWHSLAGEIEARAGRLPAAAGHFRAAVEIEDELLYFEPPPWYYPVRHSLAAVELRAGNAAAAERLYREDLRRFPENGWSLFGLAESLRAQGRRLDAEEAEERFARTWAGADVELTASRF
jgi:tetratricopeptide (TPR) repeat protein